MTRTCPWGTKPQGDHHPGEPCTLAIDHLGPCVSASERPRVHRARGITGIAIRCPQCGAPVGQGCDLAAPDDHPARVHATRAAGRLAIRCPTCGAAHGEPCEFTPAGPSPDVRVDPMSAHVHDFTGLWSNFGPRGPQDVHYHVCFGMRCTVMLIGEGHNCDGDPASHREGRLADLVKPVSK